MRGLAAALACLTRAWFTIDAQYGDWEAGPLTSASQEIITIATA